MVNVVQCVQVCVSDGKTVQVHEVAGPNGTYMTDEGAEQCLQGKKELPFRSNPRLENKPAHDVQHIQEFVAKLINKAQGIDLSSDDVLLDNLKVLQLPCTPFLTYLYRIYLVN